MDPFRQDGKDVKEQLAHLTIVTWVHELADTVILINCKSWKDASSLRDKCDTVPHHDMGREPNDIGSVQIRVTGGKTSEADGARKQELVLAAQNVRRCFLARSASRIWLVPTGYCIIDSWSHQHHLLFRGGARPTNNQPTR